MINNKSTLCSLLLCLTLTLPVSGMAHVPPTQNNQIIASLSPMLKRTTPAVVNIAVEKEIPKADNDQPGVAGMQVPPTKAIAVGSGVIIDAKNGYIATNAHIINHQKVMLVTLKDGRRYHAKLIGQDNGFDIAVIQIHAKNLVAMPLGDSSHLNVGDFAVAIGSPFGLSQTVTSGVLSALNRATPKIEGFQDFIQTDAPINPGNSGGALIDQKGNFIGMNTAILAPAEGNIGIGFAIPSNMVKEVANQLIKYGKVTAGMLGVVAQNITPELANAMQINNRKGVVVTQVIEGSPAADAGLNSEDIIMEVNNTAIHSAAELHNLMGVTHPGTKITLSIIRNGKNKKISATVGNPKAKIKQRIIPYLSGLRLQNFSDLEPNSEIIKGALVLDVTDTSAGALAGLIPGDIITKANGSEVTSIKKLISIADNAPKNLLLKVVRDGKNLFLVIEPDQ